MPEKWLSNGLINISVYAEKSDSDLLHVKQTVVVTVAVVIVVAPAAVVPVVVIVVAPAGVVAPPALYLTILRINYL